MNFVDSEIEPHLEEVATFVHEFTLSTDTTHRCPYCMRFLDRCPSVSRLDNVTEICPDCEFREARAGLTRPPFSDPHPQ